MIDSKTESLIAFARTAEELMKQYASLEAYQRLANYESSSGPAHAVLPHIKSYINELTNQCKAQLVTLHKEGVL